MAEDRCVICGEVVPEGRMVCPDCEKKSEQERDLAEELVSKWARGELVERKKGKWVKLYYDSFHCPLCGHTFMLAHGEDFMNFCPNCGADMREEKTDERI